MLKICPSQLDTPNTETIKCPLQARQTSNTSGVVEQRPAVRIPHVWPGALKPITPVQLQTNVVISFQKYTLSFYHLSCLCHPACIFPPLLGDREIKSNILHTSKQCTTGRGLLSVNVLLAMLMTMTVFFQVIEQRFLCYKLKYIRNCLIISILYIISLKVTVCRKRIWGYPFSYPL